MKDPTLEDMQTEDAFTAGPDGWITLPGGQGKISPEGVVFDMDGVEMYSIHGDTTPPNPITIYDEDDYEWI